MHYTDRSTIMLSLVYGELYRCIRSNINNNNNNNMYLKSSIQTSSIDYIIYITLNISSNIPIQYTKNKITNT